MKALLYKDFCALSSTFKFVIAFLVIFGLTFGSFSVGFMTCYCSILAVTAMNLDDNCHWDRYAVILPVSRRAIILEKYVLMLCCTLLGALLSLLRLALGLVIPPMYLIPEDGLITIAAAACVGIAMNAVSMPITLRFGGAKARIFLIAVFAAAFGGFAVIGKNEQLIEAIATSQFPPSLIRALPVIAIAVTAIILVLSALISMRIYQKKEV